MVSFLTDTVVCGFSLYHILAYFLIYSCMGWCLEVIYAAATTGQLVNRGFLNGPVCPIYGFGMVIVLGAISVWNSACCGVWARWWSCASCTRWWPTL